MHLNKMDFVPTGKKSCAYQWMKLSFVKIQCIFRASTHSTQSIDWTMDIGMSAQDATSVVGSRGNSTDE